MIETRHKALSLFIPTSAGIIFMYTLRTVCLQSRVNVLQILARTLANVQSYRTIMSAPVILVFTERAAKVNDLALLDPPF